MSFFAPGELKASTADKTIWHKLPGVFVRGCERDVEIECRWYFNDDHRNALANAEFQKLEGEARERAELESIARHVVIAWRNVPAKDGGDEPYDVSGCIQLLDALKRSVLRLPDGGFLVPWTQFHAALLSPSPFGIQLLDADDLGNA